MEKIRNKIGLFGALVAFYGVLSAILSFFYYELGILMWINKWGGGTAWLIRLALIVGGGVVAHLFYQKDETEENKIPSTDWDDYRRKIKADPRFMRFLSQVERGYKISFGAPLDNDTYEIVHYSFSNQLGQPVTPETDDIGYITVYLQRENAPQKILVGSMFVDGTMSTPDSKECSKSEWAHYVPA